MTAKIGRNDPCPCGSGQKYKKCCLGKPGSLTSVPISSLTHNDPKGKRWLTQLISDLENQGTLDLFVNQVESILPPTTPQEQKQEVARLGMMHTQWQNQQVIWPWSSRLSALASNDPMQPIRPYLDELWYGEGYRFMMQGSLLFLSNTLHQEGIFLGVLHQAGLIVDTKEQGNLWLYQLKTNPF